MLNPEHLPLQRALPKDGFNQLGRDLSRATVRRAADRPMTSLDFSVDVLGQALEAVLVFLAASERSANFGR